MTKDEKYLELAKAGAKIFSTCAKRQYMAIILDAQDHVVGMGYNGGPKGMKHCSDGGCKRLYEKSAPGSSYQNCIAIHAEANCLLHSDYTGRRNGAKMYVNGPPCFDCAKLIANSGIKKLVYVADESYVDWPNIAVFLYEAGVELVEL